MAAVASMQVCDGMCIGFPDMLIRLEVGMRWIAWKAAWLNQREWHANTTEFGFNPFSKFVPTWKCVKIKSLKHD